MQGTQPHKELVKSLPFLLVSLPIPCSSSLCGCVPFLFPAQAPCVAVFPSYSLLNSLCGCVPFLFPAQLLVWLCSLPIPCTSSLCGCVPLFPAQAPCVAVFPPYIPCTSSLCGCVPSICPSIPVAWSVCGIYLEALASTSS